MTETRWIWLETPDGEHLWLPLSQIDSIHKGNISDDDYVVLFGDSKRRLTVRAFSVHAAPAEIHPKKPPADGDTFSVQGP